MLNSRNLLSSMCLCLFGAAACSSPSGTSDGASNRTDSSMIDSFTAPDSTRDTNAEIALDVAADSVSDSTDGANDSAADTNDGTSTLDVAADTIVIDVSDVTPADARDASRSNVCYSDR